MARKAKSKTPPALTQPFTFNAPMALSVRLVGDFTGWMQQPINLQKDAGGWWRSEVTLGPGTHHYRFTVDGQWQDDPECTVRVTNPYGGQNMVRKID